MKKTLLLIGLFVAGLPMMAQEIFNFGFETPGSDLTVGKLEMVNFQRRDTVLDWTDAFHSGAKSLRIKNSDSIAGASYQRALKFRNLPIEPNTSYRVSFWVKGDNTYKLAGSTTNTASNITTALMVGQENADVPFVAANNKTYSTNFTGFDPANWVKKTAMFYYSTDADQQTYYSSLKPDSVLNMKYFLTMNVYNPGTYYIDDISILKSNVKGLTFNGDVIKVDFGYDMNYAALTANRDYNIASLPKESATVTLNGVALEVEAVEVQPTGFYIFLATEFLDETSNGKLKVSFTNPASSDVTLMYTADLRPNALNPADTKVALGFTDENADYDMNLQNISSSIYRPAFLKSATPENESFNLPLSTRSFNVVLSKKVDCSSATAKLAGPIGSVNLTLAETGMSNSLTFSVPAGTQLDNGSYVMTVSNLVTEMGTESDNILLSYEIGTLANSKIDTLLLEDPRWMANKAIYNNGCPLGWTRLTGTAKATNGAKDTGGARMFYFTAGGDYQAGMYLAPRGDNDTCQFYYGNYADYRVHMKPGKYNVSFKVSNWSDGAKNNKRTIDFVLKDTLMQTVFTKTGLLGGASLAEKQNIVVTGAALHEINFTVAEEKDYVVEWDCPIANGWDGIILGGIKLISVPSLSAKYGLELSNTLTAAKSALASVDSSIYNGTQKTALADIIALYDDTTFTAPSIYATVQASINAAVKVSNDYKAVVDAHYASIATYHTNLTNAKNTLAKYAATKYESLSSYPKLQTVAAFYDGKYLTQDDSLKVANDSLSFYNNLTNNWVNTAIPAMKYRLTKAITLAQKLNVPEKELLAAQETMIDDDAIATALNSRITTFLYNRISQDSLKFGNSALDSTVTDSLDLTNYIKNPNMYTKNTASGMVPNLFPGWVTGTYPNAGGGQTMASAVNPVSDTYAAAFNMVVDTFYQTVNNVPVGKYNINIYCREGALSAGLTLADMAGVNRAYIIVGNDTTYQDFIPGGYGIPANTLVSFRNVSLTNGTFTLGVKTKASPFTNYTPTLFWGDPSLWLVGKADGFTYPFTGVAKTEVENAVVREVQYFNIQGVRVSSAVRGLNIVKKIYDNGKVEVQKIMIK